MYDFVASLILKVRSLIEDFGKNTFETFSYTNSNVWTLMEPNINQITEVLYNGVPLTSGQGYTFNTSNNKITVTGIDFQPNDTIEVDYTFNKYTDYEIAMYIRGALVHLSIYEWAARTYYLVEESGNHYEIMPDISDPKEKKGDLLVLVTSLLILPDYIHYRMPNLAINYPAHLPREERIRDIIERYKHGIGIVDIIEWNRSPGL